MHSLALTRKVTTAGKARSLEKRRLLTVLGTFFFSGRLLFDQKLFVLMYYAAL